ncbi:carbohydrate esterase family 4 protein [Patellaria atrata CBS 101060]|uniref:chitin deacetylase n=1 Tax=Patellaria atrata CBS 101060 TaxID=1346257 RepID=A0A9P4SG69_9PEZI|nr:carbohydrate esterase family 4 protein [Patellaria atrata CBS 101060]
MFVLFLLLLLPLYCVYKPPALVIRYFQYRWPDVLWRVSTSKKIVALTIDDAPSRYTKDILRLLKDHDATATFFIIGSQVSGHEDIMEDIVRGGNELGNHAMHDEPSRSLSDAELVLQMQEVETSINSAYAAVGRSLPQRYFRPGSGFFSTKMRKIMRDIGYRMVLGNVYPHDPQIPYSSVNARHILSMVQPGSIIICHDRRTWTPPMLQIVLPELKRRGYDVVTVSRLLEKT